MTRSDARKLAYERADRAADRHYAALDIMRPFRGVERPSVSALMRQRWDATVAALNVELDRCDATRSLP